MLSLWHFDTRLSSEFILPCSSVTLQWHPGCHRKLWLDMIVLPMIVICQRFNKRCIWQIIGLEIPSELNLTHENKGKYLYLFVCQLKRSRKDSINIHSSHFCLVVCSTHYFSEFFWYMSILWHTWSCWNFLIVGPLERYDHMDLCILFDGWWSIRL